MNSINHNLDTMEINTDVLDSDGLPTGETTTIAKTVLRITDTHKAAEEMTMEYGFSDQQKEWLEELLKPEHQPLWNALLYGITSVGNFFRLEWQWEFKPCGYC